MPIAITGTGNQIKPVFVGETLAATTLAPSKREAVEALGIIQSLTTQHDNSILVDNHPITWEQAVDTLRRFVLTR